jgi:Integrase zinc binding domain
VIEQRDGTDEIEIGEPVKVLEDSYSEDSQRIATYLTTLARPPYMSTKEFVKFKRNAFLFVVRDRHLFQRASKNIPMRRVVDGEEKDRIIKELHDESGHRGRESTFRRVADRYWWHDVLASVKTYVKSCEVCQF